MLCTNCNYTCITHHVYTGAISLTFIWSYTSHIYSTLPLFRSSWWHTPWSDCGTCVRRPWPEPDFSAILDMRCTTSSLPCSRTSRYSVVSFVCICIPTICFTANHILFTHICLRLMCPNIIYLPTSCTIETCVLQRIHIMHTNNHSILYNVIHCIHRWMWSMPNTIN